MLNTTFYFGAPCIAMPVVLPELMASRMLLAFILMSFYKTAFHFRIELIINSNK